MAPSVVVQYQLCMAGDTWTNLSASVCQEMENAFVTPSVSVVPISININGCSVQDAFDVNKMTWLTGRVRRSKKLQTSIVYSVEFWDDHSWVPYDVFSQSTIIDARRFGRDQICIHMDMPHAVVYSIILNDAGGHMMQINSFGKARPVRIIGANCLGSTMDPAYQLGSDEEKDFDAVDDNDSDNKICAELKCPINMMLMRRPVVAADGRSYELRAIQRHMKTKNTSPVTGQPLAHGYLTMNHNLRTMTRDLVRSEVSALEKKKKKKMRRCQQTSISQ